MNHTFTQYMYTGSSKYGTFHVRPKIVSIHVICLGRPFHKTGVQFWDAQSPHHLVHGLSWRMIWSAE